ncbi:MAG: hypothetical protein ACLS6Q_01385 [Christensenellaceae bacterium]
MNEKVTREEIRNALLTLQRVCKAVGCDECPLYFDGGCMGEKAPEDWNINDPDAWQAFRY